MTTTKLANRSLEVMAAIDTALLDDSNHRLAAKVDRLLESACVSYFEYCLVNGDTSHSCSLVDYDEPFGAPTCRDLQYKGADMFRVLIDLPKTNDQAAAEYAHTMGICSFHRYDLVEIGPCMVCKKPPPSQDDYDAQFHPEALFDGPPFDEPF